MKVKTSITLSEPMWSRLGRLTKDYGNRSAVIEAALEFFFNERQKRDREQRDFKILNRKSQGLNQEAEDVLSYQVEL